MRRRLRRALSAIGDALLWLGAQLCRVAAAILDELLP